MKLSQQKHIKNSSTQKSGDQASQHLDHYHHSVLLSHFSLVPLIKKQFGMS